MYYGRIRLCGINKLTRFLIVLSTLMAIPCLAVMESTHGALPFDKHIGVGQNFIKPISSLCTDQSLTYLDVQTHYTSVVPQVGFFNLGVGYRNLFMPQWMSGCYMGINYLIDPIMGRTTLLNVGIEGTSPLLQLNINGYGSLDSWLGQLPPYESYLLGKVKYAADVKVLWTFFEKITPFIGGYYMGTQADSHILGYAFGVQYRFDAYTSFELKRVASKEHNAIVAGLRFEMGSGSISPYLSKPVERHLAPLLLWSSQKVSSLQNSINSSSHHIPSTPGSVESSFGGYGGNSGDSSVGPTSDYYVETPPLVGSPPFGSPPLFRASPPLLRKGQKTQLNESQNSSLIRGRPREGSSPQENPTQEGYFDTLVKQWQEKEAKSSQPPVGRSRKPYRKRRSKTPAPPVVTASLESDVPAHPAPAKVAAPSAPDAASPLTPAEALHGLGIAELPGGPRSPQSPKRGAGTQMPEADISTNRAELASSPVGPLADAPPPYTAPAAVPRPQSAELHLPPTDPEKLTNSSVNSNATGDQSGVGTSPEVGLQRVPSMSRLFASGDEADHPNSQG